jgi:hypothetical protein
MRSPCCLYVSLCIPSTPGGPESRSQKRRSLRYNINIYVTCYMTPGSRNIASREALRRLPLLDNDSVMKCSNFRISARCDWVLTTVLSRIGSSKLLLAITSTVILNFESHGTHDHILLSQCNSTCGSEQRVVIILLVQHRVGPQKKPPPLTFLF